MKLDGRVALVTGGGSGLGRAIAQTFAAEGAKVIVTDLAADTAEETVKGLAGDGHLALGGDVSDPADVGAAFARVARDYDGQLDVVVNNAGVDRLPGDGFEGLFEGKVQLLEMSDAAFRKMLDIHVCGAFYGSREAARLMIPRKSGSIINMSSIAGLAGLGPSHYASAKAGVLGLTRSLARELGRFQIRVNAICPGAIATPMTEALPDVALEMMVKQTPLQRVGEPREIASTALFLASDDGSYFTGQALSPNGGVVIG